MATITDFGVWMACYVENAEDALCAKQAVESRESYGVYSISENNGKLFMKAWGDTLMLASPKAVGTFVEMLEAKFAHEGLSLEATCDYDRAVSKDD